MSQKTLAATPNVRYPDPLVKRVNPNGTQPYTAYKAPLFSFSGDFYFANPPSDLILELLLFGADYPVKISGTQTFVPFEDQIYDSSGAPLQFTAPVFPIESFFIFSGGVDGVPEILPDTLVKYKQIATGATATNGVIVSGYPQINLVPSRNLYETNVGDAGANAPYQLTYDVTLNGAVIDGPATFFPFFSPPPASAQLPVILWEPDLTQEIVDNGYIIDINGNGSFFLNVVGLWAADNGYSPTPPMLGARSAGAPPAAERAPITRESILATMNPAMAEAFTAYAARVKNR